MAEINAQDISVYKNGAWHSLRGGKVYKNGVWQDFQGVAKGGNWYKVAQGKIYVRYTGTGTASIFLTTTADAPRPNGPFRWNAESGSMIELAFGTSLSDGLPLRETENVYFWKLDGLVNVVFLYSRIVNRDDLFVIS